MGVRKTTHIEIQNRLLAQVADLQTVAVFNNQPDAMKQDQYEDLPYQLPCVFVQLFGGLAESQAIGNREFPEYLFRLHLVTERFNDDYNGAPGQDDALERYDMLEAVMNAIDRWSGATYVAQFRVLNEILDDTATHLVHDVVELYGILQDCSLAEDLQGEKRQASDYEIIRVGESDFDNIDQNVPKITTPYR